MISETQLDANRRNAQLSTGPTTEEGKRRSSVNARRHNLTGQISAMSEEDRAAHDEFSAAMLKDLGPEGALETQLAQRIATDSWRLNRLSAIEDSLFALGFEAHGHEVDPDDPEIHAAFTTAKVFAAEARTLQLLTLYEQRLNRSVHKNLEALRKIQAERKAQRQAAIEEAKKLYQSDQFKGRPDSRRQAQSATLSVTYEVNGFVFSNQEMAAAVDHDRRLQRAERHDFRRHKHEKRYAQAA